MRPFDPKLLLASVVVIGLLLINGVFTYWNIQKLHTDTRWVLHTHKVIETVNNITSLVTVAGSNQRVYIITGDPRYLQPYNSAFPAISGQFRLLENLIQDNPEQLSRASVLKTIIVKRLRILNENILLINKKGLNAAHKGLEANLSKMVLDRLHDQAKAMVDAENKLVEIRTERFEYVYHVTLFTSLLTNFISLVMMGAFLHLLRLHLISREKNENTLFEERELFRVTINSIGDAVLTTDIQGRVTFLNAVAQSLTGWTQKEALGQPLDHVFRIIHEHTRKTVENPVLKVLQQEVSTNLANPTILIAKNGAEISIDDSAAPIKDKDSIVIGVILIFRDITEKKKIDEDRQQLAAIVDSSGDAIISKDIKGIITSWNQAAEKLFGYTAEEAIGKPVLMLIPKERHNEEMDILQHIERDEHIDHYETIRQRKDGSLIDISLTISPIKDANNVVIGASKIARDITEQHKLEEALRESEARFRKLSEDLSRSNQELEQFAYIASHDLKEPLHTISSFVDLLGRRFADQLGEKEKEYLAAIKQAALQGKTLVKELLEFSRIGKAQELQMIDLVEIIQKVKANLSTVIEESNAHIEWDEDLPQIKGVSIEMVQLFQNLIENSIKYRSAEAPKIHISAEKTEDNRWLLSVQDNGIGINAEYRDRIFNIFERLHSKSEYSGTGIGLAICKKIVENYGGEIWVESTPGKGSLFCFSLPQADER